MNSYPHTISNGAGERLTFTGIVPTTSGGRLVGENLVSPGAGPPMHVHHLQEEGFTVVRGRMGYQRPGQDPAYAEAGDSLVFRPGEPHRFWNAGETDLLCVGYIEPPGNAEFFLKALFDSQRTNGGARPSLLDVAFLLRRYRSEFAMLEIPWPVQRFLLPLAVAVGRLTGRYAKYADAPVPMDGGRS